MVVCRSAGQAHALATNVERVECRPMLSKLLGSKVNKSILFFSHVPVARAEPACPASSGRNNNNNNTGAHSSKSDPHHLRRHFFICAASIESLLPRPRAPPLQRTQCPVPSTYRSRYLLCYIVLYSALLQAFGPGPPPPNDVNGYVQPAHPRACQPHWLPHVLLGN